MSLPLDKLGFQKEGSKVPRKVTPAQFRNMVRQAEQKRRQAVNKYNSEVRKVNRAIDKYNRDAKQAVNEYNREVRTHNSRVRRNRQRLKSELTKLSNQASRPQYVTYRTSVQSLHEAFVRVETKAEGGAWGDSGGALLDLSEGEAANSVEVLNALLAEPKEGVTHLPELQETSVTHELTDISSDLDQRWRGALFALDPSNPDAARHFCASSREIFTNVLEAEAPDEAVLRALPTCPKSERGKPTRRAKVQFFLHRKGMLDDDLEEFVERDLDNVVELFTIFNEGTHGSAGKFDFAQLAAIKHRVEDAIRFLYRVIR